MNASAELARLCDACRSAFHEQELNPKLADQIEDAHPACRCENVSVGNGSPGPVGDDEDLFRVFISPRDVDPEGTIHLPPFQKVYTQGVSVIRSTADEQEVLALVSDGLWSKAEDDYKEVRAIAAARTSEIRHLSAPPGSRAFCVYDQTVHRARDKTAPHVGAHAGIFLRLPPKGTAERKRLMKDFAHDLREEFLKRRILLADFYGGVLEDLSARASNGEFVLPAQS